MTSLIRVTPIRIRNHDRGCVRGSARSRGYRSRRTGQNYGGPSGATRESIPWSRRGRNLRAIQMGRIRWKTRLLTDHDRAFSASICGSYQVEQVMRTNTFKHQVGSFRMIGNVRFVSWQDVPSQLAGDLAALIRKTGSKCRVYPLGEQMSRIFIPVAPVPSEDFPRWDNDSGTLIQGADNQDATGSSSQAVVYRGERMSARIPQLCELPMAALRSVPLPQVRLIRSITAITCADFARA